MNILPMSPKINGNICAEARPWSILGTLGFFIDLRLGKNMFSKTGDCLHRTRCPDFITWEELIFIQHLLLLLKWGHNCSSVKILPQILSLALHSGSVCFKKTTALEIKGRAWVLGVLQGQRPTLQDRGQSLNESLERHTSTHQQCGVPSLLQTDTHWAPINPHLHTSSCNRHGFSLRLDPPGILTMSHVSDISN